VPIFDQDGNFRAILDIDSVDYSKFDEVDKFHLEKIADLMSDLQWTNPE
jgi:putative methionine-R-sulfoxide reductase with GAF domain